MLAGAGLRAAEAVALTVADVLQDAEGGYALHVLEGKGRKSRTVPIQPDVAHLIRAHLRQSGRTLEAEGPLFRAHDFYADRRERKPLSSRAVGHAVREAATRAEIPKRVAPHSLRHCFALRALRNGGNVVAVQRLLGHSSLTTTQRYVQHLQTSELRGAVPLLPSS